MMLSEKEYENHELGLAKGKGWEEVDIIVGCPDNIYTEHDIEVAEAQLKKLGYNINHAYGPNSIWFLMNWRES